MGRQCGKVVNRQIHSNFHSLLHPPARGALLSPIFLLFEWFGCTPTYYYHTSVARGQNKGRLRPIKAQQAYMLGLIAQGGRTLELVRAITTAKI